MKCQIVNIFIVFFVLNIVVLACAPGRQRLRIKVDKSERQVYDAKKEDSLKDSSLQQPAIVSEEKRESQRHLQENTTNRVLHLLGLVQSHIEREDWVSAELLTLEALENVQNGDILFILQTIYLSKNEQSKADSCSLLIQRYNKEISTHMNQRK